MHRIRINVPHDKYNTEEINNAKNSGEIEMSNKVEHQMFIFEISADTRKLFLMAL